MSIAQMVNDTEQGLKKGVRTLILWAIIAGAGFASHGVIVKAPRPVGPKPGTEAREIADRVDRYCYSKQADGRTCELYARTLAAHIALHPESFNIVNHDQVQAVAQSATVGAYERNQVDPMAPQPYKSPVWVKQAASVIDAAAQAAGIGGPQN